MAEDDVVRILAEFIEIADEIKHGYATREDYEDGRPTILGYIFWAITIRRLLPDYEGPDYYLSRETASMVRTHRRSASLEPPAYSSSNVDETELEILPHSYIGKVI